jgi:hypothetical protein
VRFSIFQQLAEGLLGLSGGSADSGQGVDGRDTIVGVTFAQGFHESVDARGRLGTHFGENLRRVLKERQVVE